VGKRSTVLPFDNDGKDVPHTGDGFEMLHVGYELNALKNAFFENSDLLYIVIEKLKLLIDATACFWRKSLEGSIKPRSALADEDIGILGSIKGVLGEGGVNAILESGARLTECHTSVIELTLVANLARR
jgi:hypothetical protein